MDLEWDGELEWEWVRVPSVDSQLLEINVSDILLFDALSNEKSVCVCACVENRNRLH